MTVFTSFGDLTNMVTIMWYNTVSYRLVLFLQEQRARCFQFPDSSRLHLLQWGSIGSAFFHSVWEQEMLKKRRRSSEKPIPRWAETSSMAFWPLPGIYLCRPCGQMKSPRVSERKGSLYQGRILANGKQEEEETWQFPFSSLSHEFAFWLFWKLRMPKPCVDCQAPPCLRGKWSPRSHLPEFSTSCPFLSPSKGSSYQVSPQLTLVF